MAHEKPLADSLNLHAWPRRFNGRVENRPDEPKREPVLLSHPNDVQVDTVAKRANLFPRHRGYRRSPARMVVCISHRP
jgi:hypothetical protein